MRQSVLIARQRESRRQDHIRLSAHRVAGGEGEVAPPSDLEMGKSLRVEWKESLYLATRGGAEALGLGGVWEVGMPFDAQRSTFGPISNFEIVR
jgi:guanine deaminase